MVDVKKILKARDAQEIKEYFKNSNHLTDVLREKLVGIILRDKLEHSRKVLDNIAEQICIIFPTEKKVLGYTFSFSLIIYFITGKHDTDLIYYCI